MVISMVPLEIQTVSKGILSKLYTEQELNKRQVNWPLMSP